METNPALVAGGGEQAPTKRGSFAFYRAMTFSSLVIGYMGYYLCRSNLSVAKPLLTTAIGLSPTDYGAITSIGTLLYAVGKVVSGPWSDSFGGKRIFQIGLVGAALATLLFGFTGGVTVLFVAWGLNRAFQSMGWGGLMSVLSRWFSPADYGTASGALSISYQLGGVVATALCGLLIHLGFGWRALFLGPAVALGILGIVLQFTLKGKPQEVGYELPGSTAEGHDDASAAPLPFQTRLSSLLSQPAFLVVCGLSFVLTLVRECFNTWMPDYFAKMGSALDAAAFESTLFPLLGIIGTLVAGWVSDRLEGRRGPVLVVFLLGAFLSLLGLAFPAPLAAVLAPLGVSMGATVATLVGVTGFFILAPYSMVGGGVFALDFGGRRSAATAVGLLDGVGYVGATLSGYGVAKLVQRSGWTPAFASMAGAVLVCAFFSLWLTFRQVRGTESP